MKKILLCILLFQALSKLSYGQSTIYHGANDVINFIVNIKGSYYIRTTDPQYYNSTKLGSFDMGGTTTSYLKICESTSVTTIENSRLDNIESTSLVTTKPTTVYFYVYHDIGGGYTNYGDFSFNLSTSNFISKENLTSGNFSGYCSIMPLYKIQSLDERFVKVGNSLELNIEQKSNAYTTVDDKDIGCDQNNYVQVRLASEGDNAYRDIGVSVNYTANQISIPYSYIYNAFGNGNFLGKECKIRLKVKVSNHEFITGDVSFYYLNEVPISIDAPNSPTCFGDAVSVTFNLDKTSGFSGESNLNYLYSINEYSSDPLKACDCPGAIDKTIPDPSDASKILYLERVLISDNVPVLATSVSLNQKLFSGFYRIKAYLLQGTTMYYPAEKTLRIVDPPQFTATLSYPNNYSTFHVRTCDSEGMLNIIFKNGTGPYSIDDGLAIKSATLDGNIPMRTGNYSIIITDSKFCTATITGNPVDFTKPNPIVINSPDHSNLKCNNSGDGKIWINVTGGIGAYNSITLDNSTVTPTYTSPTLTISSLSASTYNKITLRDATGCDAVITGLNIPITQPAALNIDKVNIVTPKCSYNLSGINSIDVSGGNGTYQYYTQKSNVWKYVNTSTTFNPNDTTTIFIKDIKECTYKYPLLTLPIAPSQIALQTDLQTNASCAAASNGGLHITVSGGTPDNSGNYSINFNGSNSTSKSYESYTMIQGDYPVTVTDANLCRKTDNYHIGISSNPLNFNTVAPTVASCENIHDGQLQISVNPGERIFYPFHYHAGNGDNTVRDVDLSENNCPLINLPNGDYSITVQDNAGCFISTSSIVGLDPNRLKPPTLGSNNTPCPGISLGTITGNPVGGYANNGKFLFKLYSSGNDLLQSLNNNTILFDSVGIDNYKVTVSDLKGCLSEANIPVAANHTPIHFQYLDSSYQYCDEVVNGMIKIRGTTKPAHTITQMINTTGALDETLSNEALATLSPVPAGIYQIRAVDNIGCVNDTSIQIFNIHNDPKISVQILDSLACNAGHNGIIKVSATHKKYTGNFNYNLIGSDLKTDSLVAHFRNLTFHGNTNKYALNVIDKTGCGSDTTFEFLPIKNPVNILKFTFDTASCIRASNAGIRLEASGSLPGNPAYYYVLNEKDTLKGANRTFSNKMVGGNNKIILYDKYGCYDESLPNFGFPVRSDSLNIIIDKRVNPNCPEQSSGSLSIRSINGKPFADGFNYNFYKNGQTSPIKNEHAGSQYIAADFSQGSYIVEVSDQDECQAFSSEQLFVDPDTINLHVYPGYVAAKGATTGWINVGFDGGNGKYQVEWYSKGIADLSNRLKTEFTTTSAQLINIAAGKYLVRVKDTASCKFWVTEWLEKEVDILEPSETLALKISKKQQVSCNGQKDGEFTLEASGGWGAYLYGTDAGQITSSLPKFSALQHNNYTFYVKDSSNIISSINASMTEPERLTASVSLIVDATCYGSATGEAHLRVLGGNGKYEVSTLETPWVQDTIAKDLKLGTHTIFVRDSLACSTQISAIIGQPTQIVVIDTAITNTQCGIYEGVINATVEGGFKDYL